MSLNKMQINDKQSGSSDESIRATNGDSEQKDILNKIIDKSWHKLNYLHL